MVALLWARKRFTQCLHFLISVLLYNLAIGFD